MKKDENQTRTRVLKIAIEHFSKYGYAGTNLEMIGKEAGLTRGPLYYYFKNKKELYLAAVNYELDQALEGYRAIFEADCSFFEKLERDFYFCGKHGTLLSQVGKGGKDEPEVPQKKSGMIKVYELKKKAVLLAQSQGELRKDIDAKEMTDMIYLCFYGFKGALELNIINPKQDESMERAYIAKTIEMYKSRYGEF